MKNLRWLHLSDLHTGKDDYGQRKLFRAIIENIEEQVDSGRLPDFVFITGDLAQSGSPDEYELFGEEFLLPLDEVFPKDSKPLILTVPGNHDVDRKKAPLVFRDSILRHVPEFLDPTPTGRRLRSAIFERFSGFIEHDWTYTSDHWLERDEGAFTRVENVRGLEVGIVGVNTAWHSQDDDDKEKLAVGSDLLAEALEGCREADLKIVLGHHPLYWLGPEDAHAVKTVLSRAGAIYLHGHLHRTEARIEEGAGGLFQTFQAGASFQARDDESWQNRILWCEVDRESRSILAEPRTFAAKDYEWRLDGRAFPNRNKLPGEDRWRFPIPGEEPALVTAAEPAPEIKLSEGWELIDRADLLAHRRPVDPRELIQFFNGRLPDWPTVLSPDVPARKVVEDCLETLKHPLTVAGSPILTLITGASGEGKTTVLMQLAALLLEKGSVDVILWRPSPGTGFEPSILSQLGDQRIALVIDDAHGSLDNLIQLLNSGSRHLEKLLLLLCSRDTDWLASGAASVDWSALTRFYEVKQRGLSRVDAEILVDSWTKLGKDGLGHLVGLPRDKACEKLYSEARKEAPYKEGAFLGALLRTRLGDDLRPHVRSVIDRFEKRSAGKKRRLIDAFAYICAAHSEGLDILTDEILAWTMDLGISDLRKAILAPLGEEAAATSHGNLVVARHRAIADEAVSILTEERGYYLLGLFEDMMLAADRKANEGFFVAKLRDWRYGLIDHFLNSGRFVEGQRLSSALVDQNPANPFFTTKLCVALRKGGEPEQASEMMEMASLRVILGRDASRSFYNEWAATCLASDTPRLALWLAGVVLSDLDNIPLDRRNFRLGLQTAKTAAQHSGYPGDVKSLSKSATAIQDAASYGWKSRERDLPPLVPTPSELSFVFLESWLDG